MGPRRREELCERTVKLKGDEGGWSSKRLRHWQICHIWAAAAQQKGVGFRPPQPASLPLPPTRARAPVCPCVRTAEELQSQGHVHLGEDQPRTVRQAHPGSEEERLEALRAPGGRRGLHHGCAEEAVYEGGLPHVGLADDADGGVAARACRGLLLLGGAEGRAEVVVVAVGVNLRGISGRGDSRGERGCDQVVCIRSDLVAAVGGGAGKPKRLSAAGENGERMGSGVARAACAHSLLRASAFATSASCAEQCRRTQSTHGKSQTKSPP